MVVVEPLLTTGAVLLVRITVTVTVRVRVMVRVMVRIRVRAADKFGASKVVSTKPVPLVVVEPLLTTGGD